MIENFPKGDPPVAQTLDPSVRVSALLVIRNQIKKERETTLAERVTQEGAKGALLALAAGGAEFKEFAYQNGKEPAFIPVLAFLRSQSLVEFDFSNAVAAKISYLGYDVARQFTEGREPAAKIASTVDPCYNVPPVIPASSNQITPQSEPSVSLGVIDDYLVSIVQPVRAQCTRDILENRTTDKVLGANDSIPFDITVAPVIQYFRVEGMNAADLSMIVSESSMPDSNLKAPAFSDPFVVVMSLDGQECAIVDLNDDHPRAVGRDARACRVHLGLYPAATK